MLPKPFGFTYLEHLLQYNKFVLKFIPQFAWLWINDFTLYWTLVQLLFFHFFLFFFLQGWVANSIPGIFQWNLPEYSGLENMPKVANMENMILVL